MFINASTLKGYKLKNGEDEMGTVKEFYFDDFHWTIRYLIADTGNWLTGKQILISPHAIVAVNQDEKCITLSLTKKQIEDSPSVDEHLPVSRQYEEVYHDYYGWPIYWGGPFMWGTYPYLMGDREKRRALSHDMKHGDSHLRSTANVSGYSILASDHEIGHVDDFIIDDKTWAIRYLIIDTKNWLPGKKVLVAPQWIKRISWNDMKVHVNLLRDTIKQAPEFKDESQITREYEAELHNHYDLQAYWVDEPSDKDDLH